MLGSDLEEQTTRKAKSIAILTTRSVPVHAGLPLIESERQSIRRPAKEVVQRAIALHVVAGRAVTDFETGRSLLARYGALDFLSPVEAEFMNDPSPSEFMLPQFSWRYESLLVVLWALGLVPDLVWPDGICDVALIDTTMLSLGTEGLMRKATLRPQAEILDAADLVYRQNWAVVNARVNGRSAPGFEPGVVYERHYALNWLIGYMDQVWDDVSTDT